MNKSNVDLYDIFKNMSTSEIKKIIEETKDQEELKFYGTLYNYKLSILWEDAVNG